MVIRTRTLSLLVALCAAPATAIPTLHMMGDSAPPASPGLPFPPVLPQYPAQKTAMAELAMRAGRASAAATDTLVAALDDPALRSGLAACCARSGLANWTAEALLGELHAIVASSELAHNFDGSFDTDMTIDIGLEHNSYFASTWQLRWLLYYGNRFDPRFGHPNSPEPSGEEGVFLMPPFSGPHDEPETFDAASSRMLYIALNTYRVDVGNPDFGNVTAVLSSRYWPHAVAAAPIDTGLYTMGCNQTYMALPGAKAVRAID